MGIPGTPGADLVVVQPGRAFGLLEALFDVPAAARGQARSAARAAGPVAGVVGDGAAAKCSNRIALHRPQQTIIDL